MHSRHEATGLNRIAIVVKAAHGAGIVPVVSYLEVGNAGLGSKTQHCGHSYAVTATRLVRRPAVVQISVVMLTIPWPCMSARGGSVPLVRASRLLDVGYTCDFFTCEQICLVVVVVQRGGRIWFATGYSNCVL